MVDAAFSAGPGFVIIHIDNGGSPGPVAGFAPLSPGWNYSIRIPLDMSLVTPTLFAMLHVDDGAVGAYEFDGSSGLDNPVAVDGQVVTPSFNVAGYQADDQFVSDAGSVTVNSVVGSNPMWVVIHSDNNGTPGPVLGQTLVDAGNTSAVEIALAEDGRTSVLWPMLHVDDGTIGTYEFDGSSGLDSPVSAGGSVATSPIWTVPHVRVSDQGVIHGDNWTQPTGMLGLPTPGVLFDSILCESNCSIVIHTESDGGPGPVAGFAVLEPGLSKNVYVEVVGGAPATTVLWPMLHVDDGTVGTYEFDGSSGLDNPISVDDQVVTFPINAAPSMTFSDQPNSGVILIDSAVIDGAGWLVIHSSADGAPGPVLGQIPLRAGLTRNIQIPVDAAAAGSQVFPMLHYDTNVMGVYEFGTVDGADLPVFLNGDVVVAPLALSE
jgi:hypothetical protein